MLLKQIEIHGFKSFANNTKLNFEKGITAIVGPNGSGKSNIVDAVRWVLGEQKVKQLRGQNMQDVIFSGTESRKSQGFAYVSLTIDNHDRKLPFDYDEVVVSRRLYRSGDSEYKLNNVDCRLKDINEIFYDTGIGKEGYSIIGQGQIDRILSNKPEDRRELFDEAVGIVKFKRRKAIAEKKLEEEQLNISRVTDIIKELEDRVGPLKKQSDNAKLYLEYRDKLIEYEANFFIREIEKETKIIEECNNNLETISNDLKSANTRMAEFNEKYNQIDNEVTRIDSNVAHLRDLISENNALKEKYIGEINVLKEQINYENISNKNRDEQLKHINESIFNTIGNMEDAYGILLNIKKQIDFINDNKDSLEDSIKQTITNDYNKVNDCLSMTLDMVETVMGKDYNFDLEKENDRQLFTNNSSFLNMNDNRKEVEQLTETINSKFDILKGYNDDLTVHQKKLEELNETIMVKQNTFHADETKLETITNMLERYDGYGSAVKVIMDDKDSFTGIRGVVADLIKTSKEYEVAIEIAIGNAIQNIVVNDTDDAKNIISYLKENKLGRVTLLPLSQLKPLNDEIYRTAKNETGVIDIASNLINYDSDYEILANFLLNRCLIVDTFDNAKTISKKYNQGLKIVTLAGELFNPGGAISGGTFKSNSNLLSRKREFDELSIAIEELKNEIDTLNIDKIRCSEEYDKIYNDIDKLRSEVNDLQIEKNTKTLNIINEMKLEYTQLSSQADWNINDLNRLSTELQKLYIDKTNIEEGNAVNLIINEKQEQIDSLNNNINNIVNDLNSINAQIDDLNKEKENLLSNRKEYYESKDRLSNEVLSLQQEKYKLEANIEKSTNKIAEITQKNYENYSMTFESAKEKYKEDFEKPENLKSQISDLKKKISDLGPVNVNAIEEYTGVADRYETMTTQYNDLKESESKIFEIVKELDESMRKQFDESFKIIKQEFDKVFKELFGGGKATLELVEVNDKDVLDAGVNISAQPPGKKLGNLSQLSGGERALTAIALLFAIQNLKPSPFCLLDELDAPLDEYNVDKFADYVKKMVTDTQFILITHRRGTMEKADRLYGVTMQEKGITALVSVNLVEDQLS